MFEMAVRCQHLEIECVVQESNLEASMDLEIFNTRSRAEDTCGKGKKKIRGLGTLTLKELAEESVRKTRRGGEGSIRDAKGGR